MTQHKPIRGISGLVSDPYHEWSAVGAPVFLGFSSWIDEQLVALESRYADWATLGYGYWRSGADPRGTNATQAEAEAAE